MIDRIIRAVAGARSLWSREPIRFLYIGGLLASAAYQQLSAGLTFDVVLPALVTIALAELGRARVSPAN